MSKISFAFIIILGLLFFAFSAYGATVLFVPQGGTGLSSVTANSYLKGAGTGALVPRTYSEVKTDLSLNLVENTALSTWTGSGNITSLGTLTALTMGGNIVMADNSITGIDTLTFTDVNGTIAGVENQFLSTNIPSDENLVGHWNLDEPSGTIASDSSGNSNTGTLINMEDADWVDGVAGSCLDFDGSNDYVILSDDPFYNQNAFSISLWAYFNNSSSGNLNFLVGRNGGVDGRIYLTKDTLNRIGFKVYTNTNIVVQALPAFEEWVHIVAVHSGSGEVIKLYINGVEYDDGNNEAGNLGTEDDNVEIGSLSGTYPIDGKIDEVRIYKDQILTAKEIYALYKNPAGNRTLDQNLNTANIAIFAGLGINTSTPNQKLTIDGTMSLKEQASANADTAVYGQLWVKNTSPNQLWFTGDTGVDIRLDHNTDTKCIYFEDPTAADDFKSIWLARNASTITAMWCESDQTVNLDLQVDDGTPADVNGADLVCDSTPADDTSMGGDATLGAGERLDLAITSVSGTPTWVSLCWTFTYDD